jgi:hypothetical protein
MVYGYLLKKTTDYYWPDARGFSVLQSEVEDGGNVWDVRVYGNTYPIHTRLCSIVHDKWERVYEWHYQITVNGCSFRHIRDSRKHLDQDDLVPYIKGTYTVRTLLDNWKQSLQVKVDTLQTPVVKTIVLSFFDSLGTGRFGLQVEHQANEGGSTASHLYRVTDEQTQMQYCLVRKCSCSFIDDVVQVHRSGELRGELGLSWDDMEYLGELLDWAQEVLEEQTSRATSIKRSRDSQRARRNKKKMTAHLVDELTLLYNKGHRLSGR